MLRELINPNLVSVEPDNTVYEAAKVMERENVGTVLVLTNGKPRGILTDRDIVLRCVAKNIDTSDCTVENIMTESLVTCSESAGIFDCIKLMKEAKVRRIPVVNAAGKAVGLVSMGDLLTVLAKEFSYLSAAATVREMSEKKAA